VIESSNIPGLDPRIPNAARIYDYTLGGTHNFKADREAAEYMFSLVPSTRKWVRMLRACLQVSARRLAREGFKYYVDFASGLPTSDHIHSVLPDAKIIYSDKNPLTITHGRILLGNNPNTLYLDSDILRAAELLRRPDVERFLDGNRKVAFGANAITVFLSAEENTRFFRDLYDWAEPGSRVFATFETKNPEKTTPRWEQFVGMFRQIGEPFNLFTLDEYRQMWGPWVPDKDGGVMPIAEFLGLPPGHITEEDREGIDIEFYVVMLEKSPGKR
jgi:hypothetical protein